MKKKLSLLRVDPVSRIIAPIVFVAGKDASREVRRVTRSKRVGLRELLEVDGVPLVVAGGLDVDEAMRGWRIRGGEDTAGIGLLFGKGPGGGMVDSPVSRAWLLERIEWLEGEDVAGREERARETIDMLDDQLRDAVRNVIVLPDGMWLPKHVHDVVGPAMLKLDLGTERTHGQKLTPLGEALHDILSNPAAAAVKSEEKTMKTMESVRSILAEQFGPAEALISDDDKPWTKSLDAGDGDLEDFRMFVQEHFGVYLHDALNPFTASLNEIVAYIDATTPSTNSY